MYKITIHNEDSTEVIYNVTEWEVKDDISVHLKTQQNKLFIYTGWSSLIIQKNNIKISSEEYSIKLNDMPQCGDTVNYHESGLIIIYRVDNNELIYARILNTEKQYKIEIENKP